MDTQSSYDRVADEYVQRIFGELRDKPLDCQLLDQFAERLRGAGLCCDMGCGPGHVARYLHDRGVQMMGLDLSLEMVIRARQLTPEITFEQGDMLRLRASDATWAGITAFYSLIHIPRPNLPKALWELQRTLQPAGPLLLAFHVGDATLHLDEWWGHSVDIDFHFFQPCEMEDCLRDSGFEIEQTIERAPYPDIEHQSRRAYILARKVTDPCATGNT